MFYDLSLTGSYKETEAATRLLIDEQIGLWTIPFRVSGGQDIGALIECCNSRLVNLNIDLRSQAQWHEIHDR